ncbi:MAG: serine/threonine protein kinase [Gemmatimonadetes bacterium]|nr:serine/threonine protein kinase [Gemmatimonadota bacterium]
MPSPFPDPVPEFLPLQTALAGRYSIEREIGRGGMGIVFLAREVALDRLVALKLLPPDMAARPGLKERFLQEARTAAGLSHPNIVPIFAVDEVDGFVFFAMAYVEGGTLGDRIRDRGPLSNSEAVRLLREVAWALGYAHLQGVVHRDVKPDNILLEQASGRALVTDFGIAVLAEDEDAGAEATTVVQGTAEFMSPEQAKGGEVDARSDLYSLACVGYYALSGQVPFTGASPAAILGMHLSRPAPGLASVAPHAPPGVAIALDRCLRKDPDQRFSGGEALADALIPDLEIDRELPLPLRVFIKQTREFESTLTWCALGLMLLSPLLATTIVIGTGGSVGLALSLAGLVGLPMVSLVRMARRLLRSGFTLDDGTAALLRDVERREEEYRFQVGKRVTWMDRVVRALKLGGLAVAGLSLPWLIADDTVLRAIIFTSSFNTGVIASLFQEVRARARGDVMGERWIRFWKGRLGRAFFKLGSLRLKRVAAAISGIHRPTEVVIGLEADRLFEELPKETRSSLGGLPDTVKALEDDAQAMRRQVAEMDGVLAEIGDDDPSRPSAEERARVRSSVEATRDDARKKLREAVAALETIRLGLLYMHAGSGTVESLTMELKAAQGISDDMEQLLAGHREVERILEERRRTGVFTIVTGGEGEA